MKRTRRVFSSEFKAKVALEALREVQTLAELATKYEVHPNMITSWKKMLLEGAGGCFETKRGPDPNNQELLDRLYKQIGQMQVENDWLKKKLGP